jgi:hypothetical protein
MTSPTLAAAPRTIQYLKFIPHDKVPAYEALGWQIKSLDCHHSDYSVLGVWTGDGEPILP